MDQYRIKSGLTGLPILVVALALVLAITLFGSANAQEEPNLLVNPGFEGEYHGYVPNPPHPDCIWGECSTAQTAHGWTPWWVSQVEGQEDWRNRMPEYKRAELPYANRVHSGDAAQQYFSFGGTHTAGLLQTVQVPANARLRFSMWGQAWSNGIAWDGPTSDAPTSVEPTAVNMRIGIDPKGGTNPFSADVVWSGTANPYDAYFPFSVEAQAEGEWVTVFSYASQNEPRKHNDIYWDSASLIAIGVFSSPTTSESSGSAPAPSAPIIQLAPLPTSTPNADGVILMEVRSGASLWSVAANAGISLDEVRSLNNIQPGEFIQPGQMLVIGYGEGVDASSELLVEEAEASLAAVEESSEASSEDGTSAAKTSISLAQPPGSESEEDARPVPTPNLPQTIAIAETTEGGATICLKAFDDANKNGMHDSGEGLRANVAFSISTGQRVVSNYVTTGVSEPYCIQGLDAGSYQITRSKLAGEELTTRGDWGIVLAADSVATVEFGGYLDGGMAVASSAIADDVQGEASASGESVAPAAADGSSNLLAIGTVALAIVLVIGVVFLVMRRRTV